MIRVKATVQNEAGIHCRPSALIIKTIADYTGHISINTHEGEADPRSMLSLMSLALLQGTEVTIEVDGPDEETWATKLKELFEFHFDFPPT